MGIIFFDLIYPTAGLPCAAACATFALALRRLNGGPSLATAWQPVATFSSAFVLQHCLQPAAATYHNERGVWYCERHMQRISARLDGLTRLATRAGLGLPRGCCWTAHRLPLRLLPARSFTPAASSPFIPLTPAARVGGRYMRVLRVPAIRCVLSPYATGCRALLLRLLLRRHLPMRCLLPAWLPPLLLPAGSQYITALRIRAMVFLYCSSPPLYSRAALPCAPTPLARVRLLPSALLIPIILLQPLLTCLHVPVLPAPPFIYPLTLCLYPSFIPPPPAGCTGGFSPLVVGLGCACLAVCLLLPPFFSATRRHSLHMDGFTAAVATRNAPAAACGAVHDDGGCVAWLAFERWAV